MKLMTGIDSSAVTPITKMVNPIFLNNVGKR